MQSLTDRVPGCDVDREHQREGDQDETTGEIGVEGVGNESNTRGQVNERPVDALELDGTAAEEAGVVAAVQSDDHDPDNRKNGGDERVLLVRPRSAGPVAESKHERDGGCDRDRGQVQQYQIALVPVHPTTAGGTRRRLLEPPSGQCGRAIAVDRYDGPGPRRHIVPFERRIDY